MKKSNDNEIVFADIIPGENGLIDGDFILQLFNLHKEDVEDLSCIHQADGIYVFITLAARKHECPYCTTPTKKIKGYHTKKITHSIFHNINCYIEYHVRRYECTACGKTFNEDNPFSEGHSTISVLTVYNVLTALRNPKLSYEDVAKTFNISASSVMIIFDRHVQIPRKPLPKYILIDEVHAVDSRDSKYACVIMDFVTQDIIDILPTRRKEDLVRYFTLIPREEREKVEIICSDCWKTYREITRICFPNAIHACDEFHIIQIFTEIYKGLRVDTMKAAKNKRDKLEKYLTTPNGRKYLNPEWNKYDIQHYLLSKWNWLLMKSDEYKSKDNKKKKKKKGKHADDEELPILDPNRAKKMNKKLGRYLNFYDIHNLLIETNPYLAEAENFYDKLRAFYHTISYNEAREALNSLIGELRMSNVPEICGYASTLSEWKKSIVNSFIIIDDTGTHISTGKIESRNKIIKDVKRASNGVRNFQRFRNRCLFAINTDTPIYMPYTPKRRIDDDNDRSNKSKKTSK